MVISLSAQGAIASLTTPSDRCSKNLYASTVCSSGNVWISRSFNPMHPNTILDEVQPTMRRSVTLLDSLAEQHPPRPIRRTALRASEASPLCISNLSQRSRKWQTRFDVPIALYTFSSARWQLTRTAGTSVPNAAIRLVRTIEKYVCRCPKCVELAFHGARIAS
jgi:hypothetical protein